MSKIDRVYRMQSKQWLAALAASLAMINVATEEFWIYRTLKNVRKSDSTSQNYDNLALAGLCVGAISSMVGAILGAILADRFGRKKTLLVTSFFTIAQIISGFTTNVLLSSVTLFLGLMGLGLTRVAVPLYISEIVGDEIRGTLLMLQLPFFYVGKLIAVGFRNFESAEIVVGVISLITTSIFLIAFTWLPETPFYLTSKKKDDAATKSLTFYRGIDSITAENEIGQITKNDSQQTGCGKIHALVRPTNRRGLVIIMFLIMVKWSEQILDTRDELADVFLGTALALSEYRAKIMVHGTSLIASFLIVLTIDVIGRRPLLLFANFGGFIAMMIFLVSTVTNESILQVINIILYSCQLIFASVSLVYVGELFMPYVKPLAIAILTIFDLLISSIILLLPEIMEFDVSSWIFGILLLVSLPITFAFIPETKRKSFSEIQSKLATTFHCRWLINKWTRTNVK